MPYIAKVSFSAPFGSFLPGDAVDVSAKDTERLLDADFIEKIEETETAGDEPVTGTAGKRKGRK
jgi:hypothetical protein